MTTSKRVVASDTTPTLPRSSREEQLVTAAWLYHVGGRNQQQVADRLGVSRATVVRLLQDALEEGIVEVRVTRLLPADVALGLELEGALQRKRVRQVVVSDGEGKEAVARATSQFLTRILNSDDIVGVGWSTTLALVDRVLPDAPPHRVVQMVGSVGLGGLGDGYEIAVRLAREWNAAVATLPAPVFVSDTIVAAALRSDHHVAATMGEFSSVTVAVVGVGTVTADSTMVATGYLTAEELTQLAEDGAVCDVLGCYLDENGAEVESRLTGVRIGASLEDLRSRPSVVAVAAGQHKLAAVLGAVEARLIDTLIVDRELALALRDHLLKAKHQS